MCRPGNVDIGTYTECVQESPDAIGCNHSNDHRPITSPPKGTDAQVGRNRERMNYVSSRSIRDLDSLDLLLPDQRVPLRRLEISQETTGKFLDSPRGSSIQIPIQTTNIKGAGIRRHSQELDKSGDRELEYERGGLTQTRSRTTTKLGIIEGR
ncbi:hypothetical protein L218DRAFT_984946 [Marasmius fiardii PR-910]|nr:hypothetical protein L218DRAFT_984946 [Marasmius fiardii PR-910]